MLYIPSWLDVATICVALYIAKRLFRRYISTALPLPPGPSGLPLIGNVLDIPQTTPYKTYERWGQDYGVSLSSRHCYAPW